ncbi:MAG: DUF3995 domain-containing protein [Streptomycetaceae bacterium]|nr:DUF3995 domain-containing protein [Streptomycetaceae bacterium]
MNTKMNTKTTTRQVRARALFAPLDAVAARRLGTAVAALLAADALVHAIWTTGVTWPAADRRGLSYGLLNADVPFTARVLLPLCALLTTAAAGVYAYAHTLGGPLLRRASRLVTAAVAGGLTVRALAGVGWVAGIGSQTDTPFYWLNLLLYTPVCVGFGYAAARLAAGARAASGAVAG